LNADPHLDVGAPKDRMTTFHALLKAQVEQRTAEVREDDVGVRAALESSVQQLPVAAHSTILLL